MKYNKEKVIRQIKYIDRREQADFKLIEITIETLNDKINENKQNIDKVIEIKMNEVFGTLSLLKNKMKVLEERGSDVL